MILYFSSTGNCEYAAKKLAEATDDKCASILDIDSVYLSSTENLGFVFPTYFCKLPTIVDECMKKLYLHANEKKNHYIYFVATYGTTCGSTNSFVKKHLKAKGFELSASFSIKTVDNWTVSFDVTDKAKLKTSLSAEKAQLEEIIASVKAKETGNKMKDKLPRLAAIGAGIAYNSARNTKHLNVNDSCIGCGKCRDECPISAIVLLNHKPVWIRDKCVMCLHCLHSCPKFAINYDNKTQEHGQYKHP